MTKLANLDRGLRRVQVYRSTARRGFALASFVSVILLFLLAAYLLDVATNMGRLERGIVLVLFVVLVIWAVRRYLIPVFTVHEDPITLALMVERQQGIGSDLVAALQFSDQDRQQFGSSQLRGAVIDYTGEVSGSLDYLEGFSRTDMQRRLWLLAFAVALVLIPVIAYTSHVSAFMNRFLLGVAHYPTDTQIRDVVKPKDRAVYGRPVVFQVRAGGELPEKGRVQMRAQTSGLTTTVELTPDPEDATLYVGQLARALDDLSYTVYLGDAYTEPVSLTLVPLPIVEIDLSIETPAYAVKRFQTGDGISRRRLALQGSRIIPLVKSDKPLRSATLTVNDQQLPLKKDGDHFTLAVAGTPLEAVKETLRYEVQVVDEDGLSLERPISGTLQVRADQPPRIAVATSTQYVLPSASPKVLCRAIDDFSLAQIVVRKRVERMDSTTESQETTEVIAKLDQHPDEWEQRIRVNLSDLELEKGDRVTVIFEAVDFRGDAEGKSTDSERIVFQVTDRAGIFAALRQLDTQMDKKLDQIIHAQLGIGDSP